MLPFDNKLLDFDKMPFKARFACLLSFGHTSLKLPEVSVNVNEASTLVIVHHPVLSKCLRCGSGGVDMVFIRSDCRCRVNFQMK